MSDIKRFYLAKKKNSTTFNVKRKFLEGAVNLASYSKKKKRGGQRFIRVGAKLDSNFIFELNN